MNSPLPSPSTVSAEPPVWRSLWIGEKLGSLERMCLKSALQFGRRAELFAYREFEVPEGVRLRDAREILPESAVFAYQKASKEGLGAGSYSGFSDLFRYRMLYELGGGWMDTDISLIKPLSPSTYLFRAHPHFQAVGNVMYCPASSPLMAWCFEETQRRLKPAITDWTLPIRILGEGVERFELREFVVALGNEDRWPQVSRLLLEDSSVPESWVLVHWMNEEFRRLGLSKEAVLAQSGLHKLFEQHQIAVPVLRGKGARAYRWRISRANYLWANIKARLG